MQAHAAASPDGSYTVWSDTNKICWQDTRSRDAPYFTLATNRGKVSAYRLSPDSSQFLQISESGVEVLTRKLDQRANLSNGGGGLGKIVDAQFVGNHHVLTVWEFGKAKLWHLNSGKAIDLPDLKTCWDGKAWQSRPGSGTPQLFAMLSRVGAEDFLALHFTSQDQAPSLVKLSTIDGQSIAWSTDGNWLAVLDVPTAIPNLHIYTPDGHLFRSYPPAKDSEYELGVKEIAWSPDGDILALARYDNRVELLNARTFSLLATIEHNTTIDQSTMPVNERAPVWQENVSATNERAYSFVPQPISPPLSKLKPSTEPAEQGVAELSFSCDGSYLATRDCRMLNTVWIWNMSTLSAHAVLVQHGNVRSLRWHPAKTHALMIDCAEGIAHLWDVSSAEPPTAHHTGSIAAARLSWISTSATAKPIIMVTSRAKFELLYPEGLDELDEATRAATPPLQATFEEGASEDSLFDVLSGRKPLPPKTEPSYTERVDLDVEHEDTEQGALDDTFREKRRPLAEELDPLDDSDIF
ncbi:Putative WD40/YVTN repeat-like-containing domain superfamily [Septoria linicola]|uniref:WD40/YVTN repeat-like-containing domain superfamily n=1 Tax=Septoria linicola TaxID=215465 RepID=A0A9Q9AI92_9PEZI|nr:putative WD40/YVTN repeat-like-containing domain superfamily [Septoria linicola]USW49894.1 Putative WD40/YVTN repeat-like-containing domain superfamily [Septoria linicola]